MQLKRFSVKNLFGKYNHLIDFPTSQAAEQKQSLVILHGENGVGKTTVLSMISGILKLDFDSFRSVPFDEAVLEFSTGPALIVKSLKSPKSLAVQFGDIATYLHPDSSGSLSKDYDHSTEKLRDRFRKCTNSISFELIETHRLSRQIIDAKERQEKQEGYYLYGRDRVVEKRKAHDEDLFLSRKVSSFVRDAQVDYSSFFASKEPELFNRIIESVAYPSESSFTKDDIYKRLVALSHKEKLIEAVGIKFEKWNYGQLIQVLRDADTQAQSNQVLINTILSSYVRVLEARLSERMLLVDRISNFCAVINRFYKNKEVSIHAQEGLIIRTADGKQLTELELSSGEYHLLYLFVSALTTRRRGTVIAIDEPELSLHIAWQGRLIDALFSCASKADPQFIFATHSPDIAANYTHAMSELKG